MKNAIKKVLAFVLVIAMIAGVVPSVFAADNVGVFTDVKTTDWFAPFVKYVSEHKPVLMNGMTATTFAPNANLTRAQAVVVLYRYADPVKPNVNDTKFTDLKLDWYKEGVVWAEKNGIVNGITETTFVPDGLMTREQLVTIIWRYAGEPAVNGDFLKDFPDAAKVSSYASDAFNWAISLGIIGGANGMLEPQGNATRAQFAKIISVYVHGDDHIYEDGKCIICGEEEFSASDIVILYTNDVHTYIDKAMSYDTVADMKAKIAEQVSGVLLVDAGDHIQGTAYGSMDKGENIIKMMSAAGYDAATLGNHEFDYGMERTLKLKDEAAYPYLSCNFYNEKNGVRGDNVLDSYKIFELGGKKVALVGVTTPESFTKSTPKYFQDDAGNYIYGIAGGEDGKALYADVQKAIDAAKAEGADYIIGLGHLGDDPASDPWNSEDVIKNVSGLNAFIDGHSHSNVPQKEVKGKDGKTVILTQTGEYFGAVGKMTIKGDKITTELITEWDGSDAETKAIKDAWVSEVTEKLGEVIGHTSLTLDNYKGEERLVRKQETNTGDFAADALYYLFDTTEGLDVDVAIMNGGGVRNKAITGDISYLTCKDIHTFGNVACLQTVTGQQILDALEWGAKDAAADGSKENGGFLQVAGLTYRINTAIESTVRKDDKGVWTGGPTGGYRVSDVKVWDKEAQAYVDLDLKASYNLAGYNYTLRDLGDGFAMFAGAVNVKDYVMEDYMVIANYVKSFAEVGGKHEVVANSTGVPYRTDYSTVNGSGRITIVNEKPVEGFGLVSSASALKDGAEVVIYNPGHGMAISDVNDNNWYLVPETVAPVDNVIDEDEARSKNIVWTVVDNGDGTLSFVNGETDAIAAYVSGTYIELTNDKAYLDADIKWKVSYTDGLAYIQSSSLSNSYGPAYIECYYNANKDKTNISGYTSSNPTTKPNDFGFQFYVLGAGGDVCVHAWAWDGVMGANGYHTEKCSKCQETREVACTFSGDTCSVCGAANPLTGGEYALATSIKGGDKVVIYNPGHGMAIRNETDNNWYLVPQEITPVSDKIVDPDAILVWDVVDNGDGTFTFKNGTNAIAAYVSGTYIELTNDANYAGADIKWKVSYTDGLAYIQSSSLSNSYGPAYIECYYNANKDKTNISGYTSSNPTTKPNDFGFQFYVKDAVICNHVWAWDGVMGANGYHTEKCSKCPATRQVACTFSGDTCSVCGAAKPVTGGEYGLASSIKGGDKVVIYNPGHGMAIRNETDNNWYLVPQEITPVSNKIVDPDAILVWDVVDNGDGTFTFKNGTNAIAAYVSGTYIELTNDANYAGADIKWKVSYTDGLAYIQSSSLSNSYGPAYIECYYNANKDKTNISGYTSSNPTTKPNDFGFQFYVLGGEPIVPPVPPTGNATIVFAPEDIWEDGTGYQLLLDKDADTYDEIYEDGGFFYYDEEDGEYYYYDGDVDAAAYAEFEYKLPANADGACDTENILAGKSATVTVPAGTYDIAVTNPAPGWEYEDEEFGLVEVPGYIYFPGNGAIDDYTFEAGKTYTIKVGVNPEYNEEDDDSYYDIVTISVGGGSHEHAWAWDGKVGAAGKHTEICSECQETRQVACTLVEGVCSVCGYQKPVPSGDEIVIFYPGENKVMTTEEYTYSGKTTKIELVSADATLNGGVVSTEADNVALFKMIEDGDYVTFVTADSKYLYADGTDVKLVDAESDNTKFVIEEVSGGVYLKCAYAQYQGKPQYLEYYSGYFTVYGMGTNTSIYTFGLYPMEEIIPCDHLNTEIRNAAEPTCTKAGYTGDTYCLDCQRTIEKGTSIAALGHIDEDKDGICDRCTAEIKAGYTVAASISVGDKIVIVANHDGTDYAAVAVIGGSDTKVNNALSARTASISDGALLVDDEAAIVWEVVAGSVDGTFMLKASDGKYLAYTSSGTTLKTAKDGTEFAITCGAGTAKIMATAEGMTNRGVSFRNNEGVAQFRLYTETNNSGQYSWNLTIYKLS